MHEYKSVDILADTSTRLELSAKAIKEMFDYRDKYFKDFKKYMKLNNGDNK